MHPSRQRLVGWPGYRRRLRTVAGLLLAAALGACQAERQSPAPEPGATYGLTLDFVTQLAPDGKLLAWCGIENSGTKPVLVRNQVWSVSAGFRTHDGRPVFAPAADGPFRELVPTYVFLPPLTPEWRRSGHRNVGDQLLTEVVVADAADVSRLRDGTLTVTATVVVAEYDSRTGIEKDHRIELTANCAIGPTAVGVTTR